MTRSAYSLGLFALAALVGILLIVPSLSGSAPPQPSMQSHSEVQFSDQFSGSKLNSENWRTCHWWSNSGCTIASNDEQEWYQRQQVRVSGGYAHLVADRRRVRGYDGKVHPFASGMISTGPGPERGPRFAFTYGKATIRARVPSGPGLWPAFWLLPANRQSEPEIDVMEVTSDEPNTVDMHLHYQQGGRELSLGNGWDGLTPGWHKFSIVWRRGSLTWLVDGKRRWSLHGSKVPSQPMYLIANLAVDGDPAPTAKTNFPADYAIDWVKVTR